MNFKKPNKNYLNRNIILYMHSGSGNHGCEAIVRSTIDILNQNKEASSEFTLCTDNVVEDRLYQIDRIVSKFIIIDNIERNTIKYYINAFRRKILRSEGALASQYLGNKLENAKNYSVAISIGGDNYCYEGYSYILSEYNKYFNKKGIKTILWGCSIEPDKIQSIASDLRKYSLITARESITYDALIEAGINENTFLFPDPAFTLSKVELELPLGFIKGNTIGINVSPLIQRLEKDKNITFRNFEFLINQIISDTDMSVALIPHVVWQNNSDLEPLMELYELFSGTGRVVLILDQNCNQLKGFISRCRMFIGARTHATIAAYSSCVPTLAIGYSVKANGIAKDIFGTYENYVLPVQSLKKDDDLAIAFKWLCSNENEIRLYLERVMPDYLVNAYLAAKNVEKIIES